jgi:hypothetical protein
MSDWVGSDRVGSDQVVLGQVGFDLVRCSLLANLIRTNLTYKQNTNKKMVIVVHFLPAKFLEAVGPDC